MHIPDGFLSNPINLTGGVLAGAALAVSTAKAGKTLGEKQVPLLGVTAAFVFAAQMLNFPIAGGTSGHFLGALLAAVLLGPWNAALVMTVVLVLQCLIFSDGGLTALGSNIVNMGLIGGLLGYGVFRALRAIAPKNTRGFLVAAAVAAWSSVVMASAACALELALSGTSPLAVSLPAMAGIHALIGVGEAVITTAALSVVLKVRPDLVWAYTPQHKEL